MTRQGILILVSALALGAVAALAQDESPNAGEEEAGAEEAATETPEQVAARELCTETAAPGAYPQWTISERMTCENSFAETCSIVRESDGAKEAYTCYEPLPMYDTEPLPDADADAGGEETAAQ
ncbi:hypothetical protein [Hyphococcus sp.]|uniref:hypothetical protein n=1 Tax=Hyphococcus sp. TaxID=2038636 RepID=UPI0020848836|nr:MAG: hypothetical protein DHS20C04_12400 [Marinicaulis sp.]